MRRILFIVITLLAGLSTAWAGAEEATSGSLGAEDPQTSAPAGSHYIPTDLSDALVQLKRMLPQETLQSIRSSGSERHMVVYQFGMGSGLRNSWGLWGNSRLSKYFESLGIHHPDDMSGIILTSLWRDLHGKPIHLEEQVAYYQEYWKRRTPLPEGTTCPLCRSPLRRGATRDGKAQFTLSQGETFYYTCTGCFRLWLYTWGKGLNPPDPETRKRYCNPDDTVSSAPQTSSSGYVSRIQ